MIEFENHHLSKKGNTAKLRQSEKNRHRDHYHDTFLENFLISRTRQEITIMNMIFTFFLYGKIILWVFCTIFFDDVQSFPIRFFFTTKKFHICTYETKFETVYLSANFLKTN